MTNKIKESINFLLKEISRLNDKKNKNSLTKSEKETLKKLYSFLGKK